MDMIKNFSPGSMGINGRQSELIELALTYAFSGFDVDMVDMLRRSHRTSVEDASKYLTSAANAYAEKATPIRLGGFDLPVNLDADDDAFTAQVGQLHPLADLAKDLGLTRGYAFVPAATDRLEYDAYFEIQKVRLSQINAVLAGRDIHFGVGFQAGKDLAEGKTYPFVRTVEQFLALIAAVGEDNIGYYIDSWDWVVGDGAMDQLSELSVDQIIAVRLASLPEDVDASTATSADKVLPEPTGGFNHVKLVKHLDSIDFAGPISPAAAAAQYKGQTRESIVKRSQERLDGICEAAGLEVAPLPADLVEDIPYEPNPTSA